MIAQKRFIAAFAASSMAATVLLSALLLAVTPPSPPPDDPLPEPKLIDVIGDLQQTSLAEKVFLARGENDEARKAIIDQVARDKPDLLLLLGDQVSDGEAEGDWADFDAFMKPILDSNIQTRALIGNHDYGLTDPKRGLKYLYKRYPNTRQRPSVDIFGRIAVVMFNSNFDRLSPGEISQQAENFKTALAKLDENPAVAGILVCDHHPPYTNSELGSNDQVISMFAEPFANARKSLIFLSGHVHSYERFRIKEKLYVITGGGGGPRRPVPIGPDRPFKTDEYRPPRALRPFNFVRLHVGENSITGETMMLGKKGFFVGDKFEVKLYAPVTTSTQ